MNPQPFVDFPNNSRIHVGLAVTDLERSKQFYRALFGTEPVKERPGYVKFESTDPSVNLSLNQTDAEQRPINPATHYGIQVKSTQAVDEAARRFQAAGLNTLMERHTTCCYALQDKAWVVDPDGNRWEIFVVLETNTEHKKNANSTCCVT